MPIESSIYPLKGKVQHYAWGGYSFIPQLLGLANEPQKPFAEYWLGAHPTQPSTLHLEEGETSLYDFLEKHRTEALGAGVAKVFGGLPFLLKVLDVRQMLSIQVHPSKEAAVECFEDENRRGIAINAPNRNYKDANHKPELMVALSDFWLLHGFKPAAQLKEVLESVPEFNFLVPLFEREGYAGLYQQVMTMDQQKVNELLAPVIHTILPLYHNNELQKSEETFWAARAAETFCKNGQYDRGIFSIYFFNLLHLKRGEGIYQPAGLPHAYLEGQNIEIMANSDNVLRAGLTEKYIDVPELIKHTLFTPTVPNIISIAEEKSAMNYENPAEEFQLSSFSFNEGEQALFETTSAEIILVLEGGIRVNATNAEITLDKGASAFIVAGTSFIITALSKTVFFKAGVPLV
jgi:mannose-6-phosphate isomerase